MLLRPGAPRAPCSAPRYTCRAVPSLFFSSRSRHTRWPRDWSSDVCSSDLGTGALRVFGKTIMVDPPAIGSGPPRGAAQEIGIEFGQAVHPDQRHVAVELLLEDPHRVLDARDAARSEERRVGKECRSAAETR